MYSKTSFIETIMTPTSQLQQQKIGKLVRATLPQIVAQQHLSKQEIIRLTTYAYSKESFDVNYPILKQVDQSKSIKVNREFNNYPRYYATPVTLGNDKYLICSEWYDSSKTQYINWLKNKLSV